MFRYPALLVMCDSCREGRLYVGVCEDRQRGGSGQLQRDFLAFACPGVVRKLTAEV